MSNVQETTEERVARQRAEWLASWHMIGDFFENHPEVALPIFGNGGVAALRNAGIEALTLYMLDADEMAVVGRAMGNAEKHVDQRDDNPQVRLVRRFGAGLALVAAVDREQVCERVVTGTREVTKQVPDPDALKAVPVVEVTETVEDVEWVCRPLLAAEREPAQASAA